MTFLDALDFLRFFGKPVRQFVALAFLLCLAFIPGCSTWFLKHVMQKAEQDAKPFAAVIQKQLAQPLPTPVPTAAPMPAMREPGVLIFPHPSQKYN